MDLYCITWRCLSVISCMTEIALENVRNSVMFSFGTQRDLRHFSFKQGFRDHCCSPLCSCSAQVLIPRATPFLYQAYTGKHNPEPLSLGQQWLGNGWVFLDGAVSPYVSGAPKVSP